MARIRVAVCDHRRLVAESLAAYLTHLDDDLEVRVCTPTDAARRIWFGTVDVLLAGPASAFELFESVGRDIPILVVADDGNPAAAAALLSAGAAGIFTPQDPSKDLPLAVHQVAGGDLRLPAKMAYPVLAQLTRSAPSGATQHLLDKLTPRERQVLRMLSDGQGVSALAASLHLSPHTVRSHIRRILRKLSLHSQVEAAVLARELFS